MIYEYKCDETEEVIEEDFPMGEASQKITRDGKKFHRHFALAIKIPEYFVKNESKFKNYDKSPSGRKHFW